ncbi:MAG: iron chaperone [Chitinophagaceae bacterium]
MTTPEEYIASLPDDRKIVVSAIRKALLKNLPKGFKEEISYGMLGYCVPHSLYPSGYHCNPKLPLPFISLGSTKSHIALHHMGLYGSSTLLDWFVAEWPNHSTKKLDMGKGCIRFKKAEDVPLKLIEELAKKMTPKQWIETYETAFKR